MYFSYTSLFSSFFSSSFWVIHFPSLFPEFATAPATSTSKCGIGYTTIRPDIRGDLGQSPPCVRPSDTSRLLEAGVPFLRERSQGASHVGTTKNGPGSLSGTTRGCHAGVPKVDMGIPRMGAHRHRLLPWLSIDSILPLFSQH